jgi:hypothetical protein
MCEEERVEVVYIDKDHLHVCVGKDAKKREEIPREMLNLNQLGL